MIYRYLLLCLSLLLYCPLAHAQDVIVSDLSPNMGPVMVDHLTMAGVDNTGSTLIRGFVMASLTDLAGETIAELRSHTVELTPGESLSSFRIPWTQRFTYGFSPVARSFSRKGILGFGEFNLCFRFIDDNGEQRGIACTERRSVPALDFLLVYPLNGSTITDPFPMLSWEDVGRYGVDANTISYTLTLVELNHGQSPVEAVERNLPLLRRERIRSTSLLYPLSGRKLKPAQNYAWRVTAHSGGDEIIGSRIWSFNLTKTDKTEKPPVASSYAMLDGRLTNRYYVFDDAILFGFDNNEGLNELEYRITNLKEQGKSLNHLPPLTGLHPGLNTLSIPVEGLGLKHNGLYQLEVTTPRGQSYFLQFKIEP